jgi:FXSXX-COOH protein
MNDVADGLLLDVREISLADLEFAGTDSALSRALERILASKPDCNFNQFNNFIS